MPNHDTLSTEQQIRLEVVRIVYAATGHRFKLKSTRAFFAGLRWLEKFVRTGELPEC